MNAANAPHDATPASALVTTSVHDDGRSVTITLNDPKRRNATSIAMLDAMDAAIDVALAEKPTVIVFSGAGKSFCAGLDLDEIRGTEEVIHTLLRRLGEVMRRMRRLTPVTIAAVQGAAIGGGFGFACVCDFAVTHPEAKFGYPHPKTGLSPALMAPWLIRKIGPSRARAMMLAGGTIPGSEAFARGLATHVSPQESLMETVRMITERVLAAPGDAALRLKRFLGQLDQSFAHDDVLIHAAQTSAKIMSSPATQAALAELMG